MLIAISTNGKQLSSSVNLNFNKAPYFFVVNVDKPCDHRIISNPFKDTILGAENYTAQLINDLGVHALISGKYHKGDINTLSNRGIKAYKIDKDTVTIKEVINAFKQKKSKIT